jgi:hypothetical protein
VQVQSSDMHATHMILDDPLFFGSSLTRQIFIPWLPCLYCRDHFICCKDFFAPLSISRFKNWPNYQDEAIEEPGNNSYWIKSAAGPGHLPFFSSGAWRRRSARTSRYKDGLCAKIEDPPSLFNLGGKCIAYDIRCSFFFQLLIDATDFNSVIALPLLQR